MTLNPKIDFAIFGYRRVNCNEMDGDRPRLSVNRNSYRLSRISWALAQISCWQMIIVSVCFLSMAAYKNKYLHTQKP